MSKEKTMLKFTPEADLQKKHLRLNVNRVSQENPGTLHGMISDVKSSTPICHLRLNCQKLSKKMPVSFQEEKKSD